MINNRFNVRLSWSFYDWANSAWSAIIITFIFSRYFVDVLAPDKDLGTLYWTWTIGISSLVAALLSPILGSISDQSQRSKYWLFLSTLIYSLIAFSFWFAVPNGMDIVLIIILIFIGNISYEISQIFYNGQLKLISSASANFETKSSYSVTVTTTDAGGLTSDQSFTVTINDINDAPVVANAISDQSLNEDAALSFTVPVNTFSDEESDTLTYSATLSDDSALPSWLSFDAATQTLNISAPYFFKMSSGAITFPRDLDILCPFPSTTKPWDKIDS